MPPFARSATLVASLAAGLAVLAYAPPTRALEHQWHLGADAGIATLSSGDSSSGPGGGAHAAYGANDWLNLVLEVDATRHPSVHTTVLSGAFGAAYTLDVIRWVPYFGVLAGAYRFTGDLGTTAPGVQLALGLDYQVSRSWAVGAQVRYHTIFAADPIGTAGYATMFVRAEYLWGF